MSVLWCCLCIFFVQEEDGIRDLVRSRGFGDVYKRQVEGIEKTRVVLARLERSDHQDHPPAGKRSQQCGVCLLYTSDAADERSSVDLGGRRIIKKKHSKVNLE